MWLVIFRKPNAPRAISPEQARLRAPVSHLDWAIPEYLTDLDFVAESTQESICRFVEQQTDAAVQEDERIQINASPNPGFDSCVHSGLISQRTAELLNDSDYTMRYLRLVESRS